MKLHQNTYNTETTLYAKSHVEEHYLCLGAIQIIRDTFFSQQWYQMTHEEGRVQKM